MGCIENNLPNNSSLPQKRIYLTTEPLPTNNRRDTHTDIIRVIKSRRMRWAGHVARMGETRNVYRILVGKPEGKSIGKTKA
jgi:hypothetical protein